MSSLTLDELLSERPTLREPAQRVIEAMRSHASTGFDPLMLARWAGLDEVHVLAALSVLLTAGLGGFVIQVLNPRGQSVAEFPSLGAITSPVTDDYGEDVEVEPSNTRIVFRPVPSLLQR